MKIAGSKEKRNRQAEEKCRVLVDKIAVHKRLHGCGVLLFGNFCDFEYVW